MDHGYFSMYYKYTTLILSHWKFTIDKPLGLRPWDLSMVNFLWLWTLVVYLLCTPNRQGLYYKYIQPIAKYLLSGLSMSIMHNAPSIVFSQSCNLVFIRIGITCQARKFFKVKRIIILCKL